MEDLTSYAQKLGFDLQEPILDNTIHRFRRNGSPDLSCWYVGYPYQINGGEQRVICIFGDWRTGEKFTYKPTMRGMTPAEKEQVKSIIAENIDKEKKERQRKQDDAAARAVELLSLAKHFPSSGHLYLRTKGLSKPHGSLQDNNGNLIIPCRIGEKIHGAQIINKSGGKTFLTGQRVSGTYHSIGHLGDIIYICEGLATGGTIHEATGQAVAVAFNAQNIVKVARYFRKNYSRIQIIIAGDDDLWTKANGEPANPGRVSAELAAKESLGTAAFPKFKNLDGKPTDWNDLHVREGLGVVKEQLASYQPKEAGYVPLGFDEESHFFYSISSKSIVRTSGFSEPHMFAIMPLEYWRTAYGGPKGGVSWAEAKDALIKESTKAGTFDPFRIRGTGVWEDAGRVVINTGRELLVNGVKQGFSGHSSDYVYIQTRNRMPAISSNQLTASDGRGLVTALEQLNWLDRKHAHFLAGWIAIARVAGGLPVRPHIWLTGRSGSGKSTLMDKVIRPALGRSAGKLYLQGGTTEAGIRQSIKADSLPIIFDEFEYSSHANGGNGNERQAAILELLRQCWSRTQGTIVKGSATGAAVQYSPSFSSLLSSIRVSLLCDADRSRFTVMELNYHNDDANQYQRFVEAIQGINEEYGERLFSRSIQQFGNILASYRILRDVLATRVSNRFGQQYGMLLAGYWALTSDEPISTQDAEFLADTYEWSEELEEAKVTDEIECLNHLLSHKLTFRIDDYSGMNATTKTVDMTIGQAIGSNSKEHHEALLTYGVKVESDAFFISTNHRELGMIFRGTRWVNWAKSLRRLPYAGSGGAKRFRTAVSGTTRVNRDALGL